MNDFTTLTAEPSNDLRKSLGFLHRIPIQFLHQGDHFFAYREGVSPPTQPPI